MVVSDHVGLSNVQHVVESLVRLAESLQGLCACQMLAGCELTHVRPELAQRTVDAARRAGAAMVLGHGETIVEPVAAGTNRAYIEAGVDVLAHPGLICPEDCGLAAERGVCLEISGRKGHSLTNGHVLQMSRQAGAGTVFGTDSHEPGDLMSRAMAERVARGAGMTDAEIAAMFQRAEDLFCRSTTP